MDKLYNTLKKVFDLTEGPFDDPVISDELYKEMETVLNEYKKENTYDEDDLKHVFEWFDPYDNFDKQLEEYNSPI